MDDFISDGLTDPENNEYLVEHSLFEHERMVEAIYFEAPPAELEKIEEPDLDIDTLTELADAVLKKQIH